MANYLVSFRLMRNLGFENTVYSLSINGYKTLLMQDFHSPYYWLLHISNIIFQDSLKWRNCVLLNSAHELIEIEAWLLLTFFIFTNSIANFAKWSNTLKKLVRNS